MSEVIVRMELHENCLDCDLHKIVYGDSYADTDVYCFKEKRFVGKRFGSTKDLARPDWCPIVGVLPDEHGPLVDFNDVSKELRKYGYIVKDETTGMQYMEYPIVLEQNPISISTIVPAKRRCAE